MKQRTNRKKIRKGKYSKRRVSKRYQNRLTWRKYKSGRYKSGNRKKSKRKKKTKLKNKRLFVGGSGLAIAPNVSTSGEEAFAYNQSQSLPEPITGVVIETEGGSIPVDGSEGWVGWARSEPGDSPPVFEPPPPPRHLNLTAGSI